MEATKETNNKKDKIGTSNKSAVRLAVFAAVMLAITVAFLWAAKQVNGSLEENNRLNFEIQKLQNSSVDRDYFNSVKEEYESKLENYNQLLDNYNALSNELDIANSNYEYFYNQSKKLEDKLADVAELNHVHKEDEATGNSITIFDGSFRLKSTEIVSLANKANRLTNKTSVFVLTTDYNDYYIDEVNDDDIERTPEELEELAEATDPIKASEKFVKALAAKYEDKSVIIILLDYHTGTVRVQAFGEVVNALNREKEDENVCESIMNKHYDKIKEHEDAYGFIGGVLDDLLDKLSNNVGYIL